MGLFATIRHIKRLTQLEDRVDTIERQVHALDTEWSEVSETLRTRLAKISKRAHKLEQLEQVDHEHARGLDGERIPEISAGGLTPNQAAAQREILARRRGFGGG